MQLAHMCVTQPQPLPLTWGAVLTLEVAEMKVSEVACQDVILSVTREFPQLANALYAALQHGCEAVGDGSGELQWLLAAKGPVT